VFKSSHESFVSNLHLCGKQANQASHWQIAL
jgi:hypothetical protein